MQLCQRPRPCPPYKGFFAALSVNYLGNRMGTDLKPMDNCVPDSFDEDEGDQAVGTAKEGGGEEQEHEQSVIVLGAMDLGGSSTQIVYQPKSKQHDANAEDDAGPLTMPGINRFQHWFHSSP